MKYKTGMDEIDFEGEPKRKEKAIDPNQQSLFGVAPRARSSDPDTSHEAARSMHVAAATHRGMILKHLEKHGASTGDAIDEALGWRHATANRRLPELRRMNLIEMSDQTAVTRSGRRARMWRII